MEYGNLQHVQSSLVIFHGMDGLYWPNVEYTYHGCTEIYNQSTGGVRKSIFPRSCGFLMEWFAGDFNITYMVMKSSQSKNCDGILLWI